MEALREKLRGRKGFTLVEMLIVVAIIAILIAISIPLFNTALERTRDAVDRANERIVISEAMLVYLGGSDLTFENIEKQYFYYDAATGKLQLNSSDGIAPYGKCTQQHPGKHLFMSEQVIAPGYPREEDEGDHVGKVLMFTIDKDGGARLFWENPK